MLKKDVLTLANMGFTKSEIMTLLKDEKTELPKTEPPKTEPPKNETGVSKEDFEAFKEEIRGLFRDGATQKKTEENLDDILSSLL